MAPPAESNEELALKALAVAEKCFLAGNVSGARQWMQSALRLAPALSGIAHAAAAYDVHAAAVRRPPDCWYAVLGLSGPSNVAAGVLLTHDDIKKQHRRLCLLVHPDKNPSAAADGAFKLIQTAWEHLVAIHPPPPTANTTTPNTVPKPASPSPPEDSPSATARRRPPPPPPKRRTPRTPQQQQQQQGRGPPPQARWVPPSPGSCPSCGAITAAGKRNQRCMVCHCSPMDQCRFRNTYDFYVEDWY